MSETLPLSSTAAAVAPTKRPPPGARRVQILQTLATLLQQPRAQRITTATLAQELGVSEAALYRHFASKAQMFEGLLDFIEQSVFGLITQIVADTPTPHTPHTSDTANPAPAGELGTHQAARIVAVLLQFGEKNPGMVRVMVGDALVLEHERLQGRVNQFFDRIESHLRQCLRPAAQERGSHTPAVEAQLQAGVLLAFALGRLQRFARTGFRMLPTENLQPSLALVLAA